jgi:hypothetical protein
VTAASEALAEWEQEEEPSEEAMLAILLLEDVLFSNCRKYVADWSGKNIAEVAGPTVVLYVLCNDVFFWGCADAEDLDDDDIAPLYHMSRKPFGAQRWVALKRKMRPQYPYVKMMRDAGAWDEELDALPLRDDPDGKEHSK